jgi:hypothetical protein
MSLPAWFPIFGPLAARRRAFRDLPALAKQRGWRVVESESRHHFGTIEGTAQGHAIVISPDTPSIKVQFACSLEDFQLSMLDTGRKRPSYDLGHPRFMRVFRTQVLSQRMVDALRGKVEVAERVLALLRHRVLGIEVSPQGLTCAMHNPFYPGSRGPYYIAVADVERLLPEMIEVVQALEALWSPRAADAGRAS